MLAFEGSQVLTARILHLQKPVVVQYSETLVPPIRLSVSNPAEKRVHGMAGVHIKVYMAAFRPAMEGTISWTVPMKFGHSGSACAAPGLSATQMELHAESRFAFGTRDGTAPCLADRNRGIQTNVLRYGAVLAETAGFPELAREAAVGHQHCCSGTVNLARPLSAVNQEQPRCTCVPISDQLPPSRASAARLRQPGQQQAAYTEARRPHHPRCGSFTAVGLERSSVTISSGPRPVRGPGCDIDQRPPCIICRLHLCMTVSLSGSACWPGSCWVEVPVLPRPVMHT
jgi:hypothetical protein